MQKITDLAKQLKKHVRKLFYPVVVKKSIVEKETITLKEGNWISVSGLRQELEKEELTELNDLTTAMAMTQADIAFACYTRKALLAKINKALAELEKEKTKCFTAN